MTIEALSLHFKPEERKRGEDLLNDDVVFVATATDTTVRASVRASGAPRVSLDADDVASASCVARCSCPKFAKGYLCKHIWATLLKLDQTQADFLSAKDEISPVVSEPRTSPVAERTRERQAQQRLRAKELRREKKAKDSPRKASGRGPSLPEPVTEALGYFKENGFDLADELDAEAVLNAKRVLSRVFHPDKGGSHEEAVALNENFEILRAYIDE